MVTMLEQMMAEREARGEARGLARGVERGEARGLKRGEARGLKRGEARGRAEMLVRLLRQRFGFVPAEVEAQVRAASVAEVDAWFDACVDAPDFESVFKKSRTN